MLKFKKLFFYSFVIIIIGYSFKIYPDEIYLFNKYKDKFVSEFISEITDEKFSNYWGQSLSEIAREVAGLTLLYHYNQGDQEKIDKLQKNINSVNLFTSVGQELRVDNDAFAHTIEGSNGGKIIINGGLLLVFSILSSYNAYDRYGIYSNYKNPLILDEYLPNLKEILIKKWYVRDQSLKFYKDFDNFLFETYQKERKESLTSRYSIDDFQEINLRILMLFTYGHEIAHILYEHKDKSLENEIEADNAAALLLLTRIKGGWGIKHKLGKTCAIIEPVLLYFDLMASYEKDFNNGDNLSKRKISFMRNYLYVDSFYSDISRKPNKDIKPNKENSCK